MRSMIKARICFAPALAIALGGLIGCGGSGGSTLNGGVTYNGAPVEAGVITFQPVAGGAPFGAKVNDGKYSVEKFTAGKYTASVSAIGAPGSGPRTREEAARNPNYSPNYIPGDAVGNKQVVDIAEGGQTLDFTLTGSPRPAPSP